MTTNKKLISAYITPEVHVLLKKHSYGNVSHFIELLVQAYDQGKQLSEEEVIEGKLREESKVA